jgi:hypothetical protein
LRALRCLQQYSLGICICTLGVLEYRNKRAPGSDISGAASFYVTVTLEHFVGGGPAVSCVECVARANPAIRILKTLMFLKC